MDDQELDLVSFTDDEGNELTFEVIDYINYNGEQFALLTEFSEDEEEHECGCECEECADGCEHGAEIYIMKVVPVNDEEEEFVPVEDEKLFNELIEIANERLDVYEDGDDEDAEFADAEDADENK